jgi:hypothetical protein
MAPRKKKKEIDGPTDIRVLTGELADIDRGIDRMNAMVAIEMKRRGSGDKDLIDRFAVRIVDATAQRKRIRAINRAMEGKSLLELRLSGGPMAVLINGHQIGGEEMMAIMDIEIAFMALSGAMMIKPVSLELKSAGQKAEWSSKTSDAVEGYIAWANFWSGRKTYGDRTMEIVTRSVVAGHSFRVIEQDIGIRNGQGPKIAVRGLRDYAARAGWVTRRTATQWMEEALTSFNGTPLDPLALAIARAQALKENENA